MHAPTDMVIEHRGCTIQYGPFSNRVYLMSACSPLPLFLEQELIAMARKNQHTKVFAKVPLSASGLFVRAGYREEARIPALRAQQEGLAFLAYYTDEARSHEPQAHTLDGILQESLMSSSTALTGTAMAISSALSANVTCCTVDDIPIMAALYATVFPSYPFPLFETDFLRETMQQHVHYYGIRMEGQLVALASADVDAAHGHVEMTDFATLHAWRGKGFAKQLLSRMELDMEAQGLELAYTIARAVSPGMNRTFAGMGYTFAGRLINNTHISGNIESMNVWYKPLGSAQQNP